MRYFFVYIMASESGRLYVGVTNNLIRRVTEHKEESFEGFTKRYRMKKLVYYETFNYIDKAIAREKQIKGRLRKKKIELIESMNPLWKDLSLEWEHEMMNEFKNKTA